MKILMINSVCGIRSTGRICTDLAAELEAHGYEVKIAYGREAVPAIFQKYAVRIGSDFDVKMHGLKARLFDECGFGSKDATEKLIKWVEEYNPDIIHLHNLHGYYINIEVLFDYLRVCGKKIIWTLHDCWPFTGHAAYCEGVGCNRWVDGCYDCPNRKDYPYSLTDQCERNWAKKKITFCDIPNLTIVTPSLWLASLTGRSFLTHYPIKVIYNEVDMTVFRPYQSDIKVRLGIEDKKIVLGVAALWTKRKGLCDFIKLSCILPKEYQIVLIGLSKCQIKSLPSNIVGIERTNSVQELIELYSAADIFINPTYEDNYPTTNLESIACGTPVITYDTGGSPESARYFGAVVSKGDVEAIARTIQNMSFKVNENYKIFGEGKWLQQYCELYS